MECPICMTLHDKLEQFQGRRNCGHSFCAKCTLTWLYQRRDPCCPLCRDRVIKRAGDVDDDDDAAYGVNGDDDDYRYDDAEEDEEEENGLGMHVVQCADNGNDKKRPLRTVVLVVICVGICLGAFVLTVVKNNRKSCGSEGYDELHKRCHSPGWNNGDPGPQGDEGPRGDPGQSKRYSSSYSISDGGAIAIGSGATISSGPHAIAIGSASHSRDSVCIGHCSPPISNECIPSPMKIVKPFRMMRIDTLIVTNVTTPVTFEPECVC